MRTVTTRVNNRFLFPSMARRCESHTKCVKDYFIPLPSKDRRRAIITCDNCNDEFELLLKPIVTLQNVRQNYAPLSSFDIMTVQSFLETDAPDELLRCDDEIFRLEGLIRAVEKRQEEIGESMALHRAALSPIRRLPAEILRIIFTFYCDIGFWETEIFEERRRFCEGVASFEPFTLASTCAYWRQIVLDMPSLWTTLMLVYEDEGRLEEEAMEYWSDGDFSETGSAHSDEEAYQWSKAYSLIPKPRRQRPLFAHEVLRLILQRSGQKPLKVWIDFGYSESRNHFWSFYDTLAPSFPEFRSCISSGRLWRIHSTNLPSSSH
ncbi:hypothetical protein C8J56DRAFT_943780 [Mycena floridula]|nr:hypothetical protein C8J56DRAFT_943780 [Mycena floridula]